MKEYKRMVQYDWAPKFSSKIHLPTENGNCVHNLFDAATVRGASVVLLSCKCRSLVSKKKKTLVLFTMFRYGTTSSNKVISPYISDSSIGSPISSPSGYVSTRMVVVCISSRDSRPKTFRFGLTFIKINARILTTIPSFLVTRKVERNCRWMHPSTSVSSSSTTSSTSRSTWRASVLLCYRSRI